MSVEENKFVEKIDEAKIARSISAVYDSVSLINDLKAKSAQSEEETAVIETNVEYIKIMLAEDWFVEALTKKQLKELQAI